MSHLKLTIADLDLAVLETPVKDSTEGRTYHTFRLPTQTSGNYGVEFGARGEDLPDYVVIDGTALPLTHGKTAASFKKNTAKKGDKPVYVEVTVPEDERRDRASYTGVQNFPSIGEDRNVEVAVSVTKAGGWNLKVTVNRPHVSTPADRAAVAKKKQDTNLSALLALTAAMNAA